MNMQQGIETRERILEFIIEYICLHGYSPSVREIGKGVGLKSSSTVHNHLKKMIDSGELETDADYGESRAIRVPGYRFVKER